MASAVLKILLIFSTAEMHYSFLLPVSDLTQGCPIHLRRENLTIHGSWCYQFNLNIEHIYWHEARIYCQNQGGDLLVVDNISIQNFILDALQKLHFRGSGIWLGLAEDRLKQQWKWINGQDIHYSNWDSGYKSDVYHTECAHMQTNDGHWQATSCDQAEFQMAFVCQYNPFATKPPTTVTAASKPISVIVSTTTPASSASSPYDCNFEHGFCSWTQAKNDNFDWTRNSGHTSTIGTGPSADHTLGTDSGNYVYIETSAPRRPNDKARLQSASMTGTKCLRFWYNMYGTHINTLNVYIQNAGSNSLGKLIWTHTGTKNDEWYIAIANVMGTSAYQIVFEGVRGNGFRGDIAIDDVSFTGGTCIVGSSTPSAVCTFQHSSICGYIQDKTDDFDWERTFLATHTVGTGPSVDHTYGTAYGHYMYTESSSPRTPGQKARLIGPTYSKTTGSCVDFWYHMYGTDIGTLNVYRQNGNSLATPVWSKSSDQGNRWLKGQISLTSPFPWQLVFEGIVGGFHSDIAIDDVKISKGTCLTGGNCDFEKDLCTWTNVLQGDDFNWLRHSGQTVTQFTGPISDHTIGNSLGHYMYIETSDPRVTGDKAWLMSPLVGSFNGSRCMDFWYHMNGTGIGTLNVYMNTSANAQKLLWTQSGNKGNNWLQGHIPIAAVVSAYQIYFEGIVGKTYLGDIAIDDISYTTTACGYHPANANPALATTPITMSTRSTPSQTTRSATCSAFNCQLDCGILGYKVGHDGCPLCECQP